MKPLSKSTVRFITKSLGRFTAIFAIIALGVGFFSGLTVTETDMLKTGDKYLREHNMFDFRLISTVGFDPGTADKLERESYVETAEESKFADAIMLMPGKNSEGTVSVRSVTEKTNTLSLVSGRMPQSKEECVVDARFGSEKIIGKSFVLSEENTDKTKESFAVREFTVVGTANSPLYLNFERGASSVGSGNVSCFIYTLPEAFSGDYASEIFVTLKESAFIYTPEYKNLTEKYEQPLADAATSLAEERFNIIISEAENELAAAEAEYNEKLSLYNSEEEKARLEIRAAESKLAAAQKALDDAAAQISEKEQLLAASVAQLAAGETEYNSGLEKYTAGLEEYNRAEAEYNAALIEYEKGLLQYNAALEVIDSMFGWAESEINTRIAELYKLLEIIFDTLPENAPSIDMSKIKDMLLNSSIDPAVKLQQANEALEEAKAMLDGAEQKLSLGKAELDENRVKLDTAKAQLDAGKNELEAGKAALSEAKVQLIRGQAEYTEGADRLEKEKAEGEAALGEARKKLEDGRAELDAAKDKIRAMGAPTVITLDRTSNIGCVCFENDSSIVKGISKVFPAFFFLVAVLVCITTMTRMVEENRTHIGTLKALGYGNMRIASQFVVYSGTAAVIGAVFGFFAGSAVFPATIWKVYNIMYDFAPITLYFDPRLFCGSLAVALLCSVGTSLAACRRSLSERSAALIRPKAPKNGKRILLERVEFIWKKLKFLHKVSFRNVFLFKSRMVMMILGVGGCTALLVTGFGLNDSISNLAEFQFEDIMVYDYSVSFGDALTDADMEKLREKYEDDTQKLLFAHTESVELVLEDGVKQLNLIAVENSTDGFIDLHSGKEEIGYPARGEVVLTEKLAYDAGLKAGDTVMLRRPDMTDVSLVLTGVCENYVYNYAYTTLDTCSALWGYEPEIKTAYAACPDADTEEIYANAAALSREELCTGASVNADTRSYVENMMSSLRYIVALVCLCAAALALIVVYNLTNININERSREIATLKVLGFRRSETAAYVFRENLALSAAGAVVGLVLGKLLHSYVMSCIKIDMVAFNVHVAAVSYLVSFVMTFAFACAVDFIMFFKLDKIDMAGSLKSIE